MTAILRFKNEEGQWVHVPSLIGKTGVSVTGITRVGRNGDVVNGFIDTYRIDFSDNTSTTFEVTNGIQGEKGEKGDMGDVLVGTVTTLNQDEVATVTKTTGPNGESILDFGIPKGSTTVTYIDWGEEE